ncbi:SPW repeat protein [Priestia sp. OVL9]|nr:SPW repeat protein [Priestia sp. OVL9]
MVKTRGIINAVIGIWFVIAPWMLGFSYDAGATSASIVFGSLQVIMSFWGVTKPDGIHGKIGFRSLPDYGLFFFPLFIH